MSNNLNVITGGRGHVGFALVKELADRNENIRLLLRSDSPAFNGIKCEKVFGDICNSDDLEKVFEGATTVYHVAGLIDITGTKDDKVWEVNYEGTKKVVAACKKMGVKNLVYVSSIDAVPIGVGNELITEESVYDPENLIGAYAKSKYAATNYVLANADENFKVSVIYPSTCIGPYDNNGTSCMGSVIKFFAKGLFPITFGFGSCNFIDVRDLASAMIAAAESEYNKEKYFICGDVVTLAEFVDTLAKSCNKKTPKIVIKKSFIKRIIPVCEKFCELTKTPPVITEFSIEKLCENFNFSNEKARRMLGFNPRSLEESLKDTAEYMLNTAEYMLKKGSKNIRR